MRILLRTAILLYLAGLGVADAEAPKAAPKPEEQLTLEKFGDANKTCLQWSDGCAVCKRSGDGSFGCSVTGIACQPSAVSCHRPAQEAKPADRAEPKK